MGDHDTGERADGSGPPTVAPVRWGRRGDPGLFGLGSVTWKVNRESVMLLGGGRALLLQVAHPSVAAAVSAHSRYDADPWGRLLSTLRAITLLTFGDGATWRAAAGALRGVHSGIRGVRSDGVGYDAGQADLVLWVWATLVQSSLLVYTRYVGDLTPGEIERFYGEQRRLAAACGLPEGHCPEDYEAFAGWFDGMVADGLDVTPEARRIAQAVLLPPTPPPLSLALRPSFALLRLTTIGLLPGSLRADYGLAWSPLHERAFRASSAALRRAVTALPPLVRQLPVPR